MKIKCLVLGADGQVGKAIIKEAAAYGEEIEFTFWNRENADLTSPLTYEILSQKDFDVLINAAAYTAVDKAESEPELTNKINVEAPGKIAEICAKKGALLVQLSSDYVYNSLENTPHKETDETNPVGVYAKSKLDGEELVTRSGCNYLIIRTSWVFSYEGHNFVKTMLKLSLTNNQLSVVNDQIGSPTYAPDLANALLKMVRFVKSSGSVEIKEVFNYCNSHYTSWYDFATEIMKQSGLKTKIEPIDTETYGAIAYRPTNSRMDTTKCQTWFGLNPRHWMEALKDCLEELKLK
jgi:dTDP-4-dehydrorhamnose reductase